MNQIYDLVIVGAGPAGLSAAIYMARANYRVLVLEKEKIGGQITITSEVVNYPGVLQTSGSQLTDTMYKQAIAFGAQFQTADVVDINHNDPIKKIITTTGEISTLGIILALGANPRKLGFQGEEEFQGRGVAYCATCDGEFFRNMDVYVVGGGFAAVEEGIFLTKYASHVHMIVRGDSFSCAKSVAEKAENHKKVTIHFQTEVVKVEGQNTLNSITLLDKKSNESRTVTIDKGLGVFVFAGYVPNTSWLPDTIQLDKGYIVTNQNRETNISGIYAAGDVCIKELRQVVTAVSDGATAATSLEKYVEALQKELDLPEYIPEKKKSCEDESCGCGNHGETSNSVADGEYISSDMAVQLQPVLEKFEKVVILKTQVGTNDLGKELSVFSQECGALTDKIVVETATSSEDKSFMELCHSDGTSSGIVYEAIPGGHEFNSFLLGMLQMAGGAKPLEDGIKQRIDAIKAVDLKVMITLSCSMCPDVVVACQRIAFERPEVHTTIIDIAHNLDLRQKHNVMSVPCLLINDTEIHFGKKNMEEILTLIENV